MYRRRFLKKLGLASLVAQAPLWTQSSTSQGLAQKVLVPIFCRGGVDGLSWIYPLNDPEYQRLRPSISIPYSKKDKPIEIDDRFAFHPAFSTWKENWISDHLGIFLSVGRPGNTRSHFEEQDIWETGDLKNQARTEGWLSRYLNRTKGRGPIRAISLEKQLPRMIRGASKVLSLRSINELRNWGGRALEKQAIAQLYRESPGIDSQATMKDLLEATRRISGFHSKKLPEFPRTEIGRKLKEASQLIHAQIGVEIIEMEMGGWDTHRNQGVLTGGFFNRTVQLREGLDAFIRSLGDQAENVLIVVFTEFGRTTKENGSSGTDHGNGGVAFVWSPSIKRNGILGDWPGISPGQLHQGRDLKVTMDFRSIYRDILSGFLNDKSADEVFSGFNGSKTGLFG